MILVYPVRRTERGMFYDNGIPHGVAVGYVLEVYSISNIDFHRLHSIWGRDFSIIVTVGVGKPYYRGRCAIVVSGQLEQNLVVIDCNELWQCR